MNHIKEHRDQIMKSIIGSYQNAEDQVIYSTVDFLNLHKEFFTPHNFTKVLDLVKSENVNSPEQGDAKTEELIKSFQPTKVQYGDEIVTMYAKKIDLDNLEKGKKANPGEVREWKGGKYQKTAQGWMPVKEGNNNNNNIKVGEGGKIKVYKKGDEVTFQGGKATIFQDLGKIYDPRTKEYSNIYKIIMLNRRGKQDIQKPSKIVFGREIS